MEFRQIVAYHGPNRWSGVPTLEVLVDLGALRTWRSSADPSVIARLLSWLPVLDDPPQQAPDPGQMDFDGDVVVRRVGLGDGHAGFAHAGADLQHERCGAAESFARIDPRFGKRDAEFWEQRVPGALLGVRHAPLAQDEALDRPARRFHGKA